MQCRDTATLIQSSDASFKESPSIFNKVHNHDLEMVLQKFFSIESFFKTEQNNVELT